MTKPPTRMSVRPTAALEARLARLAKPRKQSKAAIMRAALASYIDGKTFRKPSFMVESREELEQKILVEGLASGPSTPMTRKDWNDIPRRVTKWVRARKSQARRH